MNNHQTIQNKLSIIFFGCFIICDALMLSDAIYWHKTSLIVSFLFLLVMHKFFQIINLNILYNFIHNKTFHI